MKKPSLVLAMFFALVCCAGCMRSDPAMFPAEDNAEEITIAICQSVAFEMEACAARFEIQTGVKVNIINYFDPVSTWEKPMTIYESSYDAEGNVIYTGHGEVLGNCNTKNYIETTNTDLMAGKGADIYDVGLLDFVRLGENGLLCEMSDWLEREPELSGELYINSVMKMAEQKDGSLYALKTGFYFEGLYKEEMDLASPLENEEITWEDFFEYNKDKSRRGLICFQTDQKVFMERFQDRREEFVNDEDGAAMLGSAEMVELLEQCRAWAEEGYMNDSRNSDKYARFDPLYSDAPIRWATTRPLFGTPAQYCMEPSDDLVHQWENCMVTNEGLYGINAASKSRGTAWNFIKFMLGEEVQQDIIGTWPPHNLPVYRDALGIGLAEELALELRDGKTAASEAVIREMVDEVLGKLEAIDTPNYVQPYDKIIRSAASQYFCGQLTAEQAAKQMADKVGLYLKEVG